MQQKNNSGLGLGIACTQKRLAGSSERADWQAEWQRSDDTGRMVGMQCSQELWQENSQALIPLVGNNSRFDPYSNANAYIYTNNMAVGFHLPLSLFGFLSNHIPIYYLFTIISKDYSNNNE